MRVLSLFDGISCGRVALERADITVKTYYASEIDKYATQVSNKNYPNIIRLGDINTIDFTSLIGKIDLIIGGSPCQDLSIAKTNRQGLNGERSGLFWRFVEAVNVIKPKYFLLENVASMSKENRNIISQALGVEPILINSALVSAQQRKRLYWCNWQNDLPEDKCIFLKDILESGEPWMNKSHCLTANYNGACFPHDFLRSQRPMIAELVGCALRTRGDNKQLEVRKDQKSNAMTSAQTDSMVCEPFMLREVRTEEGKRQRALIRQELGIDTTLRNAEHKKMIPKNDNKANCLTCGASRENILVQPMLFEKLNERVIKNLKTQNEKANCLLSTCYKGSQANGMTNIPMRVAGIGGGSQGNRIYSVRGKSVCLSANGGGLGAKTGLYKIDLPDGDYIVRKLTPTECERLQTLPEGYTEGISNTQRYKTIGNGWTVDVIAHLLKNIR